MRVQRPSGPIRPAPERPGGVLALDLSSCVGFAYGHVSDYCPLTGVWLLPQRSGIGARYAAYENELIDALGRFKPSLVVMEAPMRLYAQVAKKGTEAAARQQYGLCAYTEGECHRAGVKLYEEDVLPVRDRVIGRRIWQIKGAEVKVTIVAWCRDRGWPIVDHNAADAAVLWQNACDTLRAKERQSRPKAA
jgi:hypothetical protein